MEGSPHGLDTPGVRTRLCSEPAPRKPTVWWYDDGTLGREPHTGHGEVASWNTGTLEVEPPRWRLLTVLTKEGSTRFEGDSKKHWMLVMPEHVNTDESLNFSSDRATAKLKSGEMFTFWLGWNDSLPRFMDAGEDASFTAARASNQKNQVDHFFNVTALEQALLANAEILNAPYTYVWFLDNGHVGQLPPPGGEAFAKQIGYWNKGVLNYIKEPLLGTNLWKRARVVMLVTSLGRAKWFVLMISEASGYFWFRNEIDGYLMEDNETVATSCVLHNAKLIHQLGAIYTGYQTTMRTMYSANYDLGKGRPGSVKWKQLYETPSMIWQRKMDMQRRDKYLKANARYNEEGFRTTLPLSELRSIIDAKREKAESDIAANEADMAQFKSMMQFAPVDDDPVIVLPETVVEVDPEDDPWAIQPTQPVEVAWVDPMKGGLPQEYWDALNKSRDEEKKIAANIEATHVYTDKYGTPVKKGDYVNLYQGNIMPVVDLRSDGGRTFEFFNGDRWFPMAEVEKSSKREFLAHRVMLRKGWKNWEKSQHDRGLFAFP